MPSCDCGSVGQGRKGGGKRGDCKTARKSVQEKSWVEVAVQVKKQRGGRMSELENN